MGRDRAGPVAPRNGEHRVRRLPDPVSGMCGVGAQLARYCVQASLMRATWPGVNWYMQVSCV
jgi:hypothetical protein